MVGIFRSYSPAVLFALALYTILFRVALFLEPSGYELPGGGNYLSDLLFGMLHMKDWKEPLILHGLAALIVFLQALYFNVLVNHYRMLSRSSYLPAMSFILLSSLFREFTWLTPALLANSFLLVSVSKVLAAYRNEKPLALLFDAAFMISLASLFLFSYIMFFVFLVLALMFLRPFNLREYLIVSIGLMVPYYLIGVYFYWCQRFPEFLGKLQLTGWDFRNLPLEFSLRVLLVAVPVAFVALWTLFYVQSNIFRMVIQVRIYLLAFLLLFVAGVLSLAVPFEGQLDHFIWMALPLGLAFSIFFQESKRRWLAEVLHLFLILSALFFLYDFLFI